MDVTEISYRIAFDPEFRVRVEMRIRGQASHGPLQQRIAAGGRDGEAMYRRIMESWPALEPIDATKPASTATP